MFPGIFINKSGGKNMVKVMFVCHGNICRSPMAEALFRHMVKEEGLENLIYVDSSATSYEEIGNPVHRGTKKKLAEVGVSTDGIYASKLKKSDLDEYDYIFTMDQNNMNNIKREFGEIDEKKIMKFLDITENPRDIADPWYTGNFDITYDDILEGCNALMEKLKKEMNIK